MWEFGLGVVTGFVTGVVLCVPDFNITYTYLGGLSTQLMPHMPLFPIFSLPLLEMGTRDLQLEFQVLFCGPNKCICVAATCFRFYLN